MSTWVKAHLGSGMLKMGGDIRREQILAGIEIGVRSVGKSILWDSSAFVMVEPSRRDRHEGEKDGEAPAEHPQSSQVQVVLVSGVEVLLRRPSGLLYIATEGVWGRVHMISAEEASSESYV